ncbi:SGNH/GDSL hydrolase family protein [Limnohabitans sp. Jir72]|uniref:SGNH/GDSL hydrolase family protein n=1 Tax=Limnohabitans sp. Jir72 TaxID=1977909 RepID=UPI000D3A9AC0|nr:SGNH/GDSL hydrolase family protein [Limnohabitans sp. Jir72]PUE28880.1 hypothetical protein B9Z52_13845 [Limnohabitans sp. Jir72]
MRNVARFGWSAGLAALVALGLAGCGGNNSLPSKTAISKVYVMGDSLADVGTFGIKFTVQDSSNAKGFPIWPQIVASNFGLDALSQCNAYVGQLTYDLSGNWTNESYADNTQPGCTNYAIGAGRIIVPADIKNASANSANPRNIVNQLIKRANGGNYVSTDLVLIDGGGNDAADLVGAYLGLAQGPSGITAYQTLLLQQLDLSTLGTLLSIPNTGPAQAAGAYMLKLADTFYDQIKSQVLDKGATHVAVLNMPDITLTPRFQMVLAGVTAQSDAATAQALQGAIRQWISAFNTRLKANIGTDARVALVDFYTDFGDEVTNPTNYALSNTADASCPITGVGSDQLPTYTFPTCTSSALDGTTGKTPGWWKKYAFSDGFHPTPYGHSLLAASVSRALARAGWL